MHFLTQGYSTPMQEAIGPRGGMGKDASVVMKRLAGDLATKRNESYSQVVGWMRCNLTFALA